MIAIEKQFLTLGCVIVCVLSTGVWNFGVWSGALKQRFDFDQDELDTIGVVMCVAGFISWLPGMFNDNFGPKLSVMIFGSICSFSYFGMYVIASGWIPLEKDTAFILLISLSIPAYLGSAGITGACFSTIARNFPKNYGLWIPLAKCFVGLSPGFTVQMFCAYHVPDNDPKTLNYLLLMSVLVLFNSYATAPFLNLYDSKDENLDFKKRMIYMVLVTCGSILIIISTAFLQNDLSNYSRIALASILIVLYLSPFALGCKCLNSKEKSAGESLLLTLNDSQPIIYGSDASLLQMLSNINSWLLFFSSAFIIGGGFMILTNINQMLESLYFSTYTQVCVSIFSVSQAISRFAVGFVSDYSPFSRPFFVLLTCVLMTAAHILFYLFDSLTVFLIAVCLSGAAYGAIWPLMVMIVKEIWGSKYHSRNYLFYDGCCTATGALLLAKFVPGYFYSQHNQTGTNTCFGSACFSWAHLVIAVAGIFACANSLVLWRLTEKYYNKPKSNSSVNGMIESCIEVAENQYAPPAIKKSLDEECQNIRYRRLLSKHHIGYGSSNSL